MDQPSFKQGIRDCLPTLLGYFSIGLACGIVGIATHLSTLEITLLAVLVYAGAAQFIICALIAVGSPISAIIFTTFIVNLRMFLLSMTLAPAFRQESLLKNIGIGTLLTDETFGVAINQMVQQKRVSAAWMYGLNLTAYLFWILSCFLGAVFGQWISDPEMFGLDFSLTAMFLALLVLQLEHIPSGKLKLYLSLIVYIIIFMLIFCMLVPSYVAIILSTIVVASIGVIKDR